MPRRDRHILLALCEPVELTLAQVLAVPSECTRYAYFPVDSFVSLLTVVDGEVVHRADRW